MTWTLIKPSYKSRWLVGGTTIKKVRYALKLPETFIGELANWYYDDKENVIKLQLESIGVKKLPAQLTIPKVLREKFNDDTAICYLDEKAVYLSTYRRGVKSLMEFLKKERVV